MDVTYYNRPRGAGFSVEQVFSTVKGALNDKVNIREYYCSPRWARTYSLLDAWKYQGAVNHLTGDANHLALVLDGDKTIITLHDMRHYQQDLQGLKKFIFGTVKLGLPFRHVKKITTISGFMKQQIRQEFSLPSEKIAVIHNPAPSDFDRHDKEFNKDKPRILQIGSAPHKNLSRLMEAIDGLDFRLLLIRNHNTSIRRQLEEKRIEYEWHEKIPRKKVYECYQKCDILFFVSEFEGFGVPILEANAVGRPVITSTAASMPEVAGDSAFLVDPYSVGEIRQALLEIKRNRSLRDALVAKGQQNLQRFAPEIIAKQYLDLYKEVAEK